MVIFILEEDGGGKVQLDRKKKFLSSMHLYF